MDKERFFTLMGKWPKIRFTDLCLIPSGNTGKPYPELYVRDSADPPCWLFVGSVPVEESEAALARYSVWLAEFQRNYGFPSRELQETEIFLPEEWLSLEPRKTAGLVT
ncbi:hypothetical protein ACMGGR_10425 [Erwinia sp. BNK-24-b]|uniref:hypothetical protein n=1 Tax=unclassified Erwinia TaxID=2622719 RepID=UPI0039BF8F53